MHKIHLIIADTLKPFEGKKLTKRFTDKLTLAINGAKLFPSEPVCFYKHPGELHLWHRTVRPYNERAIFYIDHDSYRPNNEHYEGHGVGESHAEGFEYSGQCHGEAAVSRNKERAGLLDENSPTLDRIAVQVLEVRRAWCALQGRVERYTCGVKYAANELTWPKEH